MEINDSLNIVFERNTDTENVYYDEYDIHRRFDISLDAPRGHLAKAPRILKEYKATLEVYTLFRADFMSFDEAKNIAAEQLCFFLYNDTHHLIRSAMGEIIGGRRDEAISYLQKALKSIKPKENK